MTNQGARRIFISHSKVDRVFARRISTDLEARGHAVWIAPQVIEGGVDFVDAIQDGIDWCELVVYVESPDAQESRWVRRELLFAEETGKTIIPLAYRPVQSSFPLLETQHIDFTQAYDSAFAELLSALQAAPRPAAPQPDKRWHTGWLGTHEFAVAQASYSPDGDWLVTAEGYDQITRIWDMKTGRETSFSTGQPKVATVNGACFSAEGDRVFSAQGNGIVIARLKDGQYVRDFQGHRGAVNAISHETADHHIATGGVDKTVRVWSTESDNCFEMKRDPGHTDSITSVAFSPDGKTLATGSRDRSLRVWDVATKAETFHRDHQDPVLHVTYSPRGTYLVSCDEGGVATIWDAHSLRPLEILSGYPNEATQYASFSKNELYLLIATGPEVRVYEVRSPGPNALRLSQIACLRHETGQRVQCAIFNPTISRIVTAASGGSDHKVRVWDFPVQGDHSA